MESDNESKLLCIIPARGGSKGVKKKNIKLINDKPLIGWTIDEAKKSKYIDRVVVSTDDNEIAQVSRDFGADVVDRPKELAEDNSTSMDAVLHTLDVLKAQNYTPEFLVLLQCTSPLRTSHHIDEAYLKLKENIAYADALISVTKQEIPPWKFRTVNQAGFLKEFIPYDKKKQTMRQDFPDVYRHNGAIYINKTSSLYESKEFEPEKTLAYDMDSYSSIDIDTEMDFLMAEFFMKIRNTH